MSQNANHEDVALGSVTQTLWYPPKGCCTPAWTVLAYAEQSGPLQRASRTSSPKMNRKSSQEHSDASKTWVFFEKMIVMSWGFPMSEPSSAQVWLRTGCSAEVPWVILSNQAGYRLLWKQGGHKISTAALLSCLCTAHRAAEIHPPWFFTGCPRLL